MTVLVTADLHLGDNPRDAYRFKFFQQLNGLIKKHAIDEVFILGDLTEEKDRHSAWLVNTIVGYLARVDCYIVFVRGNHDYVDIHYPFFSFLDRLPNVRWVNSIERLSIDIGSCLFLPHTTNYQRDWKNLKLNDCDWIFAHNTFEGADVGHGRRLSGIPTNIFPCDNVISGDIHIPQKLGPVTYVGAPYTVDFGDDYEARVLLLKPGKMQSIKLNGPQKRLVDAHDIPTLVKTKGINVGDILKVRWHLKPGQQAKWNEIQTEVRAWGDKHGYIIHTVQPVAGTTQLGKLSRRQSASRSDEQLVETYAKNRKLDARTLKTGLSIMGKP